MRTRHPTPRVGLAALLLAAACAAADAAPQGLGDLYDAALRHNPTLAARRFDVDLSQAETDLVRSRLRPQVSLLGGLSGNDYRDSSVGSTSYGGRRLSINARQSLYDPAMTRRVEAAQATVVQRGHELASAKSVILGELLERYLQALMADDVRAAIEAERSAADRQADRLRVMRERQMARVDDVAEAEAYVQSLVTRAIDASNDRAESLARLGELAGIEVTAPGRLVRTSFEPVPGSADSWAQAALAQHPRLAALAQAVQAARRQAEAARAERLPQVAATLSRVHANQGFDNRRQPSYHVSALGLELRIPLYEGGRPEALQGEAAARIGLAEQQLEEARRAVERELRTLWLSAQANHARIGSTAGEVQAMELTVAARERALELGAARINDLLEARRRLLRARADQARARYDFVRDLVLMRLRTGEPAAEDLREWSGWFEAGPR